MQNFLVNATQIPPQKLCEVSTDGQIAINRQIDVRELRVNAHTIVCGRSAITNRVRASVWAFTHALANVDLAVETLFSITPV